MKYRLPVWLDTTLRVALLCGIIMVACLLFIPLAAPLFPRPEADAPLYVYPETECAYGWAVRWEYNGVECLSLHETKEQAGLLYAVLAGRMVAK